MSLRASALAVLLLTAACRPHRSATTSLHLRGKVPDAHVVIDDEALGPLAFVAKRGVALKPGRHRVSVSRDGYFPWDREIDVSGSSPLQLDVDLSRIPQ